MGSVGRVRGWVVLQSWGIFLSLVSHMARVIVIRGGYPYVTIFIIASRLKIFDAFHMLDAIEKCPTGNPVSKLV